MSCATLRSSILVQSQPLTAKFRDGHCPVDVLREARELAVRTH
jgi:hypothetical protein